MFFMAWRETFTSLLARHQSYRIARGVLDQRPIPTPVLPNTCKSCGQKLALTWNPDELRLRCRACEAIVELSPHTMAKLYQLEGIDLEEEIRGAARLAEYQNRAEVRDRRRLFEAFIWFSIIVAVCSAVLVALFSIDP
jgi:hypothetical protein